MVIGAPWDGIEASLSPQATRWVKVLQAARRPRVTTSPAILLLRGRHGRLAHGRSLIARSGKDASMAREINKVGVVGLGTMGAGIVEVLARKRHRCRRGRDRRRGGGARPQPRSPARPIGRWRRASSAVEDRDALLGRITFAVGLDALRRCRPGHRGGAGAPRAQAGDLRRARPDLPAAKRFSSPTRLALSVTEISVATHRLNRVVGMHFFNPAPIMPLIEVVKHRGHRA